MPNNQVFMYLFYINFRNKIVPIRTAPHPACTLRARAAASRACAAKLATLLLSCP